MAKKRSRLPMEVSRGKEETFTLEEKVKCSFLQAATQNCPQIHM